MPTIVARSDDSANGQRPRAGSNVILTLARIWTTLATGDIRSKDEAASWALERLAPDQPSVLARARAIYLGEEPEQWDDLRPEVRPQVETLVSAIDRVVRSRT
jgi:streptomycin 3"-adenylyltransferase